MNQPLISVIIPVYGISDYALCITQCVESVINQTYCNLEILLVDDGSPKEISDMCDHYAECDARVRVIHKAHSGVSDARNTALDQAKGEFIAFVDNDDWILPETYQRMMEPLQNNCELDVVCCACSRFPNPKNEVIYDYYPAGTIVSGRDISRRMLLDEIGSQIVFGLYKRHCWDDVRFPTGRLYEDLATTYKAYLKASKVYYLPEPFYIYRTNQNSISRKPNVRKTYDIYLAFKDHYDGAVEHFPEIAGKCCAMAAHFAVSNYFHYCALEDPALEDTVKDVRGFLKDHKSTVMKNWNCILKSRKFALRLYYFFPGMFRIGAKFLRITGLQERLGLSLK